MENFSGGISPKLGSSKKQLANLSLWSAVRNGSVHDVELSLGYLKKNSGNIDARNIFGSTALHIAAWRNNVPILKRLLEAGADPNSRDGESGWSSLHRALHFGHLAVAGVLIEAGGSLVLEDSMGRTPVDLLSGPVKTFVTNPANAGAKEVFSWGNGSNYQLGTGTTGIVKVPGCVHALQGLDVIAVAAAKFHSVALTASGEVYSWGFGRGGRLGHPDFYVHSGQVAVITPRQIISSFGGRGVRVIAVAKHHTIVATDNGEVYTWGSNREGRLGYPSVDTQSTPRRVSTLKTRVVAIAAASRHNAVLTESGEVFTWGCNSQGQLGYGSTSNFMPRCVDCLKGKKFVSVAAAKYHTVVLGAEGEVYTWGYKMVNPQRVMIARNVKKGGTLPLKFHISERLHVVSISAGVTHSTALSEEGLLFYWFSSDIHLRCHQLMGVAGHQAIAVWSGKYRTAFVTRTGDVYSWDGENLKYDATPVPVRVHGIKHAICLSVAENHSLVVSSLYIPPYPPNLGGEAEIVTQEASKMQEEVDDDIDGVGLGEEQLSPKNVPQNNSAPRPIPSLKDLCQKAIAQSVVEPKNSIQVLEFADAMGGDLLRRHCEDLILRNLDYILTISPISFGNTRPSLLAGLERSLDASSTQSWSHRRLPTPTATMPLIVDSEEENADAEDTQMRALSQKVVSCGASANEGKLNEGFLQQVNGISDTILKPLRAVRKKLQQIEALELKQSKGQALDAQQLSKLKTKVKLKEELVLLESGIVPNPEHTICKQYPKNGLEAKGNFKQKALVVDGIQNASPDSFKSTRKCKNKSQGRVKNKDTPTKKVEDMQQRLPCNSKVLAGVERMETTASVMNNLVTAAYDPKSSSFKTIAGFPSDISDNAEDAGQLGVASGSSKTRKGGVQAVGVQAESTPTTKKMLATGKRVVRGGLSVFLSGALDEVPKVEDPSPKQEGPAWGRADTPKISTSSLREIQSQQQSELQVNFGGSGIVGSGETMKSSKLEPNSILRENTDSSMKRVLLSQFVKDASPVTVTNPIKSLSSSQLDNSPPPWAGAASGATTLSFRDIQLQEVKNKAQQRQSHSRSNPQTSSPVGVLNQFSGSSTVPEHNMSSSDTPNRWFKPEAASPSSLCCIQIEETAMKELRQLYKNVKLVSHKD